MMLLAVLLHAIPDDYADRIIETFSQNTDGCLSRCILCFLYCYTGFSNQRSR